jgi:hypothetical protein
MPLAVPPWLASADARSPAGAADAGASGRARPPFASAVRRAGRAKAVGSFTQTRPRASATRLETTKGHYPLVDTESLFLRTLDDLEKRTNATDEYEILLAAALLRKLLLDSPPLIDQVNATHRLKLRFRINGPTAYEEMIVSDGAVFFSPEDAIDPELDHPPALVAPIDATRDQLLARRVMLVNGEQVTIHHLIDQLAHIEGAVHRSDPRERRQAVLNDAARQLFIGGPPAGTRQIQAVARVVLRGLRPLRDAVRKSTL